MSTFYTLLTKIGVAEFINAAATVTTVPFTHLVLGDGGGSAVSPKEEMSSMVREVSRVPISSVTPDVNNPSWLVIEAVVPTTVGGWTVREVGIIGGSGAGGKLIAVGNFPDTYKPVLSEGSARDLVVRMIVQVGNASVVNLTVDPSVAVATNQSIANSMAAHLVAVNPHPQYTLLADFTQHKLAADPHSQYVKVTALSNYMTQIKTQELLDALDLKVSTKAGSGLMGLALFNQGIY